MVKPIRKAISVFLCLCVCMAIAINALAGEIFHVEPKPLEAPDYSESDDTVHAVANGANAFAFRLSAELLKDVGAQSFVCSPYSVWLPLAALVNATNEDNKAALCSAIGAAGITEADVNAAASRIVYGLTQAGNEEYEAFHNPLKIANAVFVANDVTLKETFVQTFTDCFRGTAMNVDFSSQQAVDVVNQWASEQTDGLIPELVQQFDPMTVATIANAIYFSDGWRWAFAPNETKADVFYAPNGDTMAMFMLHDGVGLPYYEDDRIQVTHLGFCNGGGMYILLPKEETAVEFLSSMNNDYFMQIESAVDYRMGKLLLPRFSIDTDVRGLKEVLEALGVPLFDAKSAPLTDGIIEEDMPVWLSNALHKAIIRVDEKGTTAAAVTATILVTGAMSEPTKAFEMVCSKPFAFILYERSYKGNSQILFTGIVQDTSGSAAS